MLFTSPNEISLENLAKHQLIRQPFADIPVNEGFFISNATSMIINTIAQTIEHADSELCIVKGEKGIGKSCLANYLHNSEQAYESFFYTGQKRTKVASMLKSIINDDEFESNDTQHLAKQAAIEIFHALKDNKQPVLIIDDAHLIKEATLLTLIRFTTAIKQQGVGKLKLIFIAEKSIDNVVNKIPEHHINANTIHSVLLRPLTHTETETYINHCTSKAGNSNALFNKKQLELITNDSAGLPAKINIAAASILNKHSRHQFWANKNIQFGGYVAAAMIFIGLGFLYTNNVADDITVNDSIETAQSATTNDIDKTAEPISIDDTLPVIQETIQDQEETQSSDAPEQAATLETSVDELIAQATAEATPEPEVSSIEKANNSTSVPNEPVNDSLETLKIDELEVASQVEKATTTLEPEPYLASNTVYSHRWLLEQPQNSFALQLIGTANYEKLMAFSETFVTNCTLAYFRTVRNGSPWHVLLCGPYQDSKAALDDIQNLPANIQKNRPWARDLATIQQKIKATLNTQN